MREQIAEIGIFGGSGFYQFLEAYDELEVDTPFGSPSDRVTLGEVTGRRIAFMPRHARDHSLPPHSINYRANLWAFKELGVVRVLSPCAAGSLDAGVRPGDFVICDQVVDRTWGRKDTFFDGPETTHVSLADPYCPELRGVTIDATRRAGLTTHESGTMVVIQGPRFATRAESAFHAAQGWTVVSMTQYPEVVLARELEMCSVNISLITDHDAGVEGVEPVSVDEVVRVFRENNQRLVRLIAELIPRIPRHRSCNCGSALATARL